MKLDLTPRWRPGAYARDGVRIFAWLLLRAAAQAAAVLLLARWLGAQGYGAFVAAVAVASFFTPLAGFGFAAVVVRDGARHPQALPALLRRGLRVWWAAATVCSLLAVAALHASLPQAVPLAALLALAVAEVGAGSLVEILSRVEQARQRAARFGAMQAGLPLARLAGLLALAASGISIAPAAWIGTYAASSLLYAALLAWALHRRAPRANSDAAAPTAPQLLREGAPFAAGALAFRLQAEFNKPVLAHLGYAQAGAFGVAQRIVDLASLPLAALQEALWPRVFASADPRARLRRTGAALLVLAMSAGLLLAAAAPLLPRLLGPDYALAAASLRWLALLPALQVLRNLGNAWMMASGHSQRLLFVYAAAAATGVLLALLLVPAFGMVGAVWGLYGSELAALVAQMLLSRWQRQEERAHGRSIL